jgi:predicted 3-demethylubiquinone-9 3-methyltransferase (glyoxalase superfamily)
MTDHPIAPCLWFDGTGEEAAKFYVSLLGGAITRVKRYEEGAPFPAGTALLVEFELRGRPYQALNGGPHFKLSNAISLSVPCDTQAEIDHLWESLLADGGVEAECGWLTDRFGLSWQIVPAASPAMMNSADTDAADRVLAAMMGMVKFDIAKLEAAFAG